MNKILLIILINIIIIFGYKYKISLYILPFIFIIGSVLYIQLIYVKDKELLEGFNDEDVLSYWNQIEDTADKDIEIVEDNLINKIDSVVKLLTKLETSDNNKYAGQQCEGEFKLIKSHKECGINAYDEYKYVISKQGDNCEYMPGYTYRKEKELCKIDKECEDKNDCDKGAKCVKNKCKIGFECSSTELDNCNKEDCKKLNNEYGGFSYEFLNGKCTTSRCNVNEYFNCNSKDTCEGLGFNYKWDPKTLPRCQKKEEDVKTCSEIDCPENYFPIISNKDKACRRPANPDEKIDQFSKIVEINGKKYLDRCNTEVCCQPSYKCGQYFVKSIETGSTRCDEYYDKIISTDKPNDECYSEKSSNYENYNTFDLGANSSGTIYYVWNDIDSNGNIWSSGKENSKTNKSRQESIQQKYCNDRSCRDCIKGVEKAACSNGLPVNSADYDDDLNSSIQCKSCNAGFSLQDKECKQCDEKTYQTETEFTGSDCTSCTPPSDSHYKDWGCDPKNGSFIGKTCDIGYKMPGCEPCEPGTYQPNTGTDVTECLACPSGSYTNSSGSSECTDCDLPPHAHSGKCVSDSGILTSITCKAGYKVSGLTCAPCESGKYQPTNGRDDRACQSCDSIPLHALDYGDGNECDRISGNVKGRDDQDGVKCIENYKWEPDPDHRDHGSCVFQGCPKGYGVLDESAARKVWGGSGPRPSICGLCDFNRYNPTEGNQGSCQACPTPDPYLVYSLSLSPRNSVDEVEPDNKNYCDAITGFTKINTTRTDGVGGCIFKSSAVLLWGYDGDGGFFPQSDTCQLPTCREAFNVSDSQVLPAGHGSTLRSGASNDAGKGVHWYYGNTCAANIPYNDQYCKNFYDRDDKNIGQYCSGATNMQDCWNYLARGPASDGFTRCQGTGNSGHIMADMKAPCANSTDSARCRNEEDSL